MLNNDLNGKRSTLDVTCLRRKFPNMSEHGSVGSEHVPNIPIVR